MPERFGIYFAPAVTGELWRHAAIWLSRDAATDAAIEADIAGIDPAHRFALTRSARRYGFHATLKAPIALDGRLGGSDLDKAMKAWAAETAPVEIGRLMLKSLDGFLALVPVEQSAELTDFAGRVVEDFDGFRAPASPEEQARRMASTQLNPRQIDLLDKYGYPYVFEQFRFHMTLTDRLQPEDAEPLWAAADAWFAPTLNDAILLDRLVLFQETEPGAPFRRLRDYPLTGDAK
jgi:putative phosphonate metabolism protein